MILVYASFNGSGDKMGNLERAGRVKMLQGVRAKAHKKLAKLDKVNGVPHGIRRRQRELCFDHAKMVLR
jgi:hypothetical protein